MKEKHSGHSLSKLESLQPKWYRTAVLRLPNQTQNKREDIVPSKQDSSLITHLVLYMVSWTLAKPLEDLHCNNLQTVINSLQGSLLFLLDICDQLLIECVPLKMTFTKELGTRCLKITSFLLNQIAQKVPNNYYRIAWTGDGGLHRPNLLPTIT